MSIELSSFASARDFLLQLNEQCQAMRRRFNEKYNSDNFHFSRSMPSGSCDLSMCVRERSHASNLYKPNGDTANVSRGLPDSTPINCSANAGNCSTPRNKQVQSTASNEPADRGISVANHMSIKMKKNLITLKTALVLQLACADAFALPSLETTTSFAQCIVATQISYAEMKMTGQHSTADTFQRLSRRLSSEVKASAVSEQELNYIERLIDSEFSVYQRMGDTQQLRYAIQVLERNQCNRLRL